MVKSQAMTLEQEEHVGKLLYKFVNESRAKYEKGAIEHDSNIWDWGVRELIEFAIEEAIDQVMYLYTLREKYEQENLGHRRGYKKG